MRSWLCGVICLTGFFGVRGDGSAQVLFSDSFDQFANGTTEQSGYSYDPAGSPAGSFVKLTCIPTSSITVSNIAGSIWLVYDCPASSDTSNYNDYLAEFSAQTNPVLSVTWNLRMGSLQTNAGPAGAILQLPLSSEDESIVVGFADAGQIYMVTNVYSSLSDLITVGSWANLAGTTMTNQLLADYESRTMSLWVDGSLIATRPMRPDLISTVDHIEFEFAEQATNGALGNWFALDNINVSLIAPTADVSIQPGSLGVQDNKFSFQMSGPIGSVVVVQAATNLANPVWIPVSTNGLADGSSLFSDPQLTNYPCRFYRLQIW